MHYIFRAVDDRYITNTPSRYKARRDFAAQNVVTSRSPEIGKSVELMSYGDYQR